LLNDSPAARAIAETQWPADSDVQRCRSKPVPSAGARLGVQLPAKYLAGNIFGQSAELLVKSAEKAAAVLMEWLSGQ